jgi:3-oxoacyl-[acyl-carrier-protein] synthase III
MAVEAGRNVRRAGGPAPATIWLATAAPTYLDKTNAAAVHAALRLDRSAAAYDVIGSVRSTAGALRAALDGSGAALAIGSDLRTGRPGLVEESAGADAAAAVLVGDDSDAPVLADLIGHGSITEEFLDRWRSPGDGASRVWEERFGETKYLPLAAEALSMALADAGLGVDNIDALVVAGLHERACAAAAKNSGVATERVADRLSAAVGNPGAAQPLFLLARALERANPGAVIVLWVLSDGADAFVFRATDAIAAYRPARPVASQILAVFDVGADGSLRNGRGTDLIATDTAKNVVTLTARNGVSRKRYYQRNVAGLHGTFQHLTVQGLRVSGHNCSDLALTTVLGSDGVLGVLSARGAWLWSVRFPIKEMTGGTLRHYNNPKAYCV